MITTIKFKDWDWIAPMCKRSVCIEINEMGDLSLLLKNVFNILRIICYLDFIFTAESQHWLGSLCSTLRFSFHLLFDVCELAKVAFHGSKAIVQYWCCRRGTECSAAPFLFSSPSLPLLHPFFVHLHFRHLADSGSVETLSRCNQKLVLVLFKTKSQKEAEHLKR